MMFSRREGPSFLSKPKTSGVWNDLATCFVIFVGICHWWCTLKCLMRQVVLDPILGHHCLKEAWKLSATEKRLSEFFGPGSSAGKSPCNECQRVGCSRRTERPCDLCDAKKVRPVCGSGVGHWRKATGLICPWEDLDVFRYELERLELSCKFLK